MNIQPKMFNKFFSLTFLLFYFIVAIDSKKSRIVNGEFALPGQFPHQVSIQYLTTNNCTYFGCGGSIMDEWHVITAAHCVTDNVTREILDLPWTVVAGTVDLQNRGAPAVYHDVNFVFVPMSYMANSPEVFEHDIAVLRLKRPLPLGINPYLMSIQLPTADQYLPPNDQSTAVVSGFGTYYQARDLNGVLTSSYISQFLRFARGIINVPDFWGCKDSEVCFESLGKRQGYLQGTCSGDSGGPLYDEKTNILIGVTSYSNYPDCGEITRYTRVSAHLLFISEAKSNNFDLSVLYWKQLLHDYEGYFPILPVCGI